MPSCDDCRALYARRKEQHPDRSDIEPPCEDCLTPLLPENKEIANIYMLVRDQHIMSMSGPVGLNLVPLFALMDEYKVKDRKRCLSLVRHLYHKELKLRRAEIESKKDNG